MGRVGLAAGLVVAMVLAFSIPASATNALMTVSEQCTNGVQVITWTITNQANDRYMTIDHAIASIGDTPVTVSGYASPVAPSGSTTATATLASETTGTIQLYLYVEWPNYAVVNGISLDLFACSTATSTTTTTTTTTTTPPTSTSSTSTTSTSTTPTSPFPTTTTSTSTSTTSTTSTTYPTTTSTMYPTTTTYCKTGWVQNGGSGGGCHTNTSTTSCKTGWVRANGGSGGCYKKTSTTVAKKCKTGWAYSGKYHCKSPAPQLGKAFGLHLISSNHPISSDGPIEFVMAGLIAAVLLVKPRGRDRRA